MDDVLKLFGVMSALGMAGALTYAGILLANTFARRVGGTAPPAAALEPRVEELHDRVARLEEERTRLVELEERLDFAERLLARQKDPGRLP